MKEMNLSVCETIVRKNNFCNSTVNPSSVCYVQMNP